MSEHIRAAVEGAIAGWTLGAQCRGRKGFRALSFYDPIPPRMAPSHALEAWLVWSAHLRGGRSVASLCKSLADNWHYPIDETVFGLGNVSRGLTGPVAGAFNNPLATASEAIGRAAYWGLAFHGRPDEAAEHAYYDASIDHAGEGVWVSVALARTIALLEPGKPLSEVVRDLTNSLHKESLLLAAIPRVLKNVGEPDGARSTREDLPASLKLSDPYDAVLSASWVLLGLAHGGGRFEESVSVTAGCGGAANHTTLVSGLMCGLLSGSVPQAWTKPLGDALVCGHGLRRIDPPKTIDTFVKTIVSDFDAHGLAPTVAESEANELSVASEEGETTTIMETVVKPSSPPMSQPLVVLLGASQDSAIAETSPLRVSMQYLDPPVAYPAQSLRLSVSFTNTGDTDVTLTPSIEAPQGWDCAHKIGEFVLTPGFTSRFALVVKPKGEPAAIETVRVVTQHGTVGFPIFASQLWYWVGPMSNVEGTGFDKEYPAQTNIKLGQVFNGRSNMPVEWKAVRLPGERIDVEQLFGSGPGVLYFYCAARMPSPGAYKIVAASGVGVIVWIDGVKKFWYHDTHTPVPRAREPYLGSFSTDDSVKVLIKTFRNLDPVPPMSVYFLAEDGSLAIPVAFEPIA